MTTYPNQKPIQFKDAHLRRQLARLARPGESVGLVAKRLLRDHLVLLEQTSETLSPNILKARILLGAIKHRSEPCQ